MASETHKAPAQRLGRSPPVLLLSTLIPISLTLIAHPLLPILLPDHITDKIPLPPQPAIPALQASIGFALLAFVGAVMVVPRVADAFLNRGLKGRDLLKPGGRSSGPWIPESLGLPCASLYIGLMMLFIPFPFSHLFHYANSSGVGREVFPRGELNLFLSSLLSLFTATLLGFLDDLFDIRWRHKLPIPLIAAIPMLLVYYSEGGLTSVVLPASAGQLLMSLGLPGWIGNTVVDLGFLYYVYLLMLPTFTTNAINILAGINGVETMQAMLIAMSVALNDLLFLPIWSPRFLGLIGVGIPEEGRLLDWAAGEVVKRHLMSLYFMLPLIGVCAGFLYHNWFPARAFPGDTLCYFTGMAFSAVAMQGHFAKTLILFFMPQIFNFILSCPQLFRIVPCPRHRLPQYNAETGRLSPSLAVFEAPPALKTRLTLELLELLGLTRLERAPSDKHQVIVSATNLTLINWVLVHFGPLREQTLCLAIGAIQVAGTALAFAIRYGLGTLVYGGDRR